MHVQVLKKFETIGINIDVNNLVQYISEQNSKIIDTFVNDQTKQKCDEKNTKVIIYSKSPYGKTNYKLETILDCCFEETNK